MSKKTRHKRADATRFTCHAPEAKAVFLAGTFNDWNPESTPMARDADGNWRAAVDLKPGHYEYKFVVDGAWWCGSEHEGDHEGCPECVPNPFGTRNRVIEVK